MKKVCINLLTIIVISCLASSQALADIYLHNNYGSTIDYAILGGKFGKFQPGVGDTKQLGNSNQVKLILDTGKNYFYLRPYNYYHPNKFQEVTDLLEKAQLEQVLHPDNDITIYLEPTSPFDKVLNRWTTKILTEKRVKLTGEHVKKQ